MGILTHKLYRTVTAFCLTVWISLPAIAAEDMDQLFDRLANAAPAEATQITREIERSWSQSGSTSLDMLLRRGRKAMEEEDYTAAIEHFSALTDHAPDFAEGFHARASAYYESGRFGPAFTDLSRALALNPRHYNAIFGLGVMLMEVGEDALAVEAFEQVLDLHPHHEEATQALERMKSKGIGREL